MFANPSEGGRDSALWSVESDPGGRETPIMVVWAVVSAEIQRTIRLYRSREEAERMLALVLRHESDWRRDFYIERLEVGSESPN